MLGKPIEILDFETPVSDYIVLESVTLQNIRIIHVISMFDRNFCKVGRGHDVDIRVTDISVSRFHAKIVESEAGDFYVEDNHSKFGTLIQIRRP
jgi:pSer/pThr/pTyr-binding forkhead associated (FHA) protein